MNLENFQSYVVSVPGRMVTVQRQDRQMYFFLVKEKDCLHPCYPISKTPGLNPGFTEAAMNFAFDFSGTIASSCAPYMGMQNAKVFSI